MSNDNDIVTLEVWTEGKTDRMHLKTAMRKLGIQLPVSFHESQESMGDDKLKKTCETFAKHKNTNPIVFIFDRDKENIIKDVSDPNNPYKSWGNNVYSFVIPEPNHRKGYTNISIEFYYSDEELLLTDSNSRRLYLTSEFIETSGKHKTNKLLSIGNKGILTKCTDKLAGKIIDSEVYGNSDSNVALSKANFADYISSDSPPFDCFDFSEFRSIFNILAQIVRDSTPIRSVYIPDFEVLFDQLTTKPPEQRLSVLFNTIKRLMALAMQVFIISTIRVYENAIINEPPEYRKKVRPIVAVLKEKFFTATLKTCYLLAEKCFYIVDTTAPPSLIQMKHCLEEDFLLDSLGQVLDDLNIIFPPRPGTAIQTNKAKIRRSLLKYVFPEITEYDGKSLIELEESAVQYLKDERIKVETWEQALQMLADQLQPVLSLPIELRTLKNSDERVGTYIVEKRTYHNGISSIEEIEISTGQAEEYQTNYSHLFLDAQWAVHLYPMLLIKDNSLFFYQRSRGIGYEYYSLASDRVHIEHTKKKFDLAVFKTGSTQEFFWTEAIPVTNPSNGIRANIPQEGLDEFVGRVRQKTQIREEILEIPNQNGIVYGPGGIGKTALMQQLTQELFMDTDPANRLFDNIVWVTAKANYYDYIFGTIEPRSAISKSLDHIITALLQFFEFENLEEYSTSEKKELLLEILLENRTLLIIDNFETIEEEEALRIVRFFAIDVKKHLRSRPDCFKVIITSRKQIPSGFHHLPLKGLEIRESRLLMRQLMARYRRERLTDSQEYELYEATQGIPIVLKHCFGQMFEFNKPLQTVLRELTNYHNEIVQFSYKEILQQLERRDQSGIQLKTLLLLESLNYPMTISQMAQVINTTEQALEKELPPLLDFQCLQATFIDGRERYKLNDDIRLFTKSLTQRHVDIVKQLRERVTNSLVEQGLEANEHERQLAQMFENYLAQGQLLDAADFINEQLQVLPSSILLNYHYARYLLQYRQEYEQAIERLEQIRELSGNRPKILALLVKCFMASAIPRYELAQIYVKELENYVDNDEELRMQIAEFYTDWSSHVKSQFETDPLNEQIRQRQYKELADKALALLEPVPGQARTDRYFYLCAQCHFNKWDYDKALQMIKKAIDKSEVPGVYERFKRHIVAKQDYYKYGRYGK